MHRVAVTSVCFALVLLLSTPNGGWAQVADEQIQTAVRDAGPAS